MKPLAVFQSNPVRKLPESLPLDSFGLTPRGSLLKKELIDQKEGKYEVTLAKVTAGLRLYGIFPGNEAIINSILWKVNRRLIVRYQNHDYVLILKEASENQIKIGWLEDESLHEISMSIPSHEGFIEQPEEKDSENPESILVLDTPKVNSLMNNTEKKQ